MKKFLLSISVAIACAGLSTAGEITMFMGDATIQPGSYVFNDIEIDEDYYEVTMDPNLSIMADRFTTDVQVIAACTSGQMIQMCCGGMCERNTTVTKVVNLQANSKLPLQFEYIGEFSDLEEIPTVVTDISVEELGSGNPKKVYTIIMNQKAGVNDILGNGKALSVMRNSIYYNVDGMANIEIYNLSGVRVMSNEISGTGNIDLSILPSGAYIYKMTGDSKATGKIIR